MVQPDRSLRYVLLTVGGVCLASAMAHAQTTIYVDDDANGGGDGSSWGTAYHHLQDALAAAADIGGPDIKIWVAQGTYRPDLGVYQTPGARGASFQLVNFATLRGGYAGCGAPDPNARDVRLFETILSGDLAADDQLASSDCCTAKGGYGCDDPLCQEMVCVQYPSCCEDGWTDRCALYAWNKCCDTCKKCDNAFNVVTVSSVNVLTIFDGFTVSGGSADRVIGSPMQGGGIYNQSGDPKIRNCTFIDNFADDSGGAIWNFDAAPELTGCTFAGNKTLGAGGAIYNWANSDSIIVDCVFTGNVADFGGAVANSDSSNSTLRDCTFSANWARESGGAIYNLTSSPVFYNCAFTGNSSSGGGGAAMNNQFFSSPTLCNCLFSGNRTEEWPGGGMYNYKSTPTMTNCTFSRNRAVTGGGVYSHSSPTFAGRTPDVASSGTGPRGTDDYRASVTLDNCVFWGNSDDGGTDESAQIDGDVPFFINYSCIQGWTGVLGGVGNNGYDPLLVDALGPDGVSGTGDENLRLAPDSPCVDDGDPEFTLVPGACDLDGVPRVLCDRVDRGAYEFGIGDYDCDRCVDLADFAHWVTCVTGPDVVSYAAECRAFDFGYDDDVDLADYAGFQSALTAQ